MTNNSNGCNDQQKDSNNKQHKHNNNKNNCEWVPPKSHVTFNWEVVPYRNVKKQENTKTIVQASSMRRNKTSIAQKVGREKKQNNQPMTTAETNTKLTMQQATMTTMGASGRWCSFDQKVTPSFKNTSENTGKSKNTN